VKAYLKLKAVIAAKEMASAQAVLRVKTPKSSARMLSALSRDARSWQARNVQAVQPS
jgi:predicted NAD-dependent protein-ADP-ribosyltransferase YbiA (DUF1768 family)